MTKLAPLITLLSAIVLAGVSYACFPRRMNELAMWTIFGVPMWFASMVLCALLLLVTVYLLLPARFRDADGARANI